MERNTIIVIVLAALVLISMVQAVEIASVKGKTTGNSINSNYVDENSGGESYDEMMARMHPDQYKSAKQTQSSGPTMVGGC